jgi:hypothetical protein
MLALIAAVAARAVAGPYSDGADDPLNAHDAPVPGFVGPHGDGMARVDDGAGGFETPDNYVNPLCFGWAWAVDSYEPAPGVAGAWSDPSLALGELTGAFDHIVALGELSAAQIAGETPPGQITLQLPAPAKNCSGADIVIFENGLFSEGGAGVAGQLFAELAYVEVSSNGTDFARFPSRSMTSSAVNPYGTIDPTDVFNLAGKHGNAYGTSWGTPFDLSQLAADPLVSGGQVDLNNILYVRLVDIPGNGSFTDSLGSPIYDAWQTFGSGGFDVEAVGVISRAMSFPEWTTRQGLAGGGSAEQDDPDADGLPNLLEYAFGSLPDGDTDSAPRPAVTREGDRLKVSFLRDERAVDLRYDVQVSNDLTAWTTIARSTGGGQTVGANGFSPAIAEMSASATATVGVLRNVEVTDVADLGSRRFVRISVIRQP